MNCAKFIEGINKKEERALQVLYEHYYAALCSYAEKLLNDCMIAEDIVQECLIKMWNTKVSFPNKGALSAWLYKSVYHASVSELRERYSQKKVEESKEIFVYDEKAAQELALREETITYFYKILHQLPKQQQDILLYTLKGYRVQDIARIFDVSENSIKTQKKRAYEYVREHFDVTKLFFLYVISFRTEN